MRQTPTVHIRPAARAAMLGCSACLLTGCHAERVYTPPTEPSWSYHDGNAQLSNNDTWDKMVPESFALGIGKTQVASVEDPTR